MSDSRIVYGLSCTWWDDIGNAGKHPRSGLPCCPHCKGMLFELANPEQWWSGVDTYAKATGDKEYPGLIKWMKGRCFADLYSAKKAYKNSQEPWPRPIIPPTDPDMPAEYYPGGASR